MFSSKEAHFIVLHDLDEAREALERELAQAEPALAPGLRRAREILAATARGGDEPKYRWARQALDAAGVDPRAEELKAIRALRQALPGLGLAAAVDLVKGVARG
ncbi:hypothetical protein ACFVHB_34750 [Kitasatospora sp. NPDC127111]|uniref:hypothetical protein n=1 Tax=Kitasatospora sp. NPDC127111 TaxID=3345363 RepID=UPI00363B7126